MPSIVVVLATYNGAKYLAPFLDSVRAQDQKPDRIVVVDDASQDETLEILSRYQSLLPLEIHPRKSNGGHRVAFAEALSHAREDWIVLADQDDLWEPRKISTLLARAGSADLVHSDASVIDTVGNGIHASWHRNMNHPFAQTPEQYLLGWNNVTGCTAAFRSGLLARALPIPEGVPVHDWWLSLAASVGKGIAYVDEPLIRYRIHENNAVGRGKQKTFSENLRSQTAWFKALVDHGARIGLTPSQLLLANRMERISRQRLIRKILPEWFPWIWSMRTLLFQPGLSPLRLGLKSFMMILGLPLLRYLGKQ